MESGQGWDAILNAEKAVLARRRDKNAPPEPVVGLALSGGGIRSATFNLGVMQVLEKAGILKLVDYLSTVSGGGYAGAFLLAERFRGKLLSDDDKDPALRHLRTFSNYLTPSMGLLSMDTWSMVMIWLRNTITLQAFLVCVLAAVLLLPRFYAVALDRVTHREWLEIAASLLLAALTMVLSYVAASSWKNVESETDPQEQRRQWCAKSEEPALRDRIGYFVTAINALMVVCAALFAIRLHGDIHDLRVACRFGVQIGDAIFALALFSLGYSRGIRRSGLWLAGSVAFVATNPTWLQLTPYDEWHWYLAVVELHWLILLAMTRWGGKVETAEARSDFLRAALAAAVSALVGYGGMRAVMTVFGEHSVCLWVDNGKWFWHYVMFAVPALLAVFALTLVTMMAMVGRAMPDLVRESWTRLGAGLGILSAGIFAVVGFAVYSPRWTEHLQDGWTNYAAGAGGSAAALLSVVSFFAARGGDTSGKKDGNSRMDLLASVAPVGFVVFLLGAVSYGVHRLVTAFLPPEWTGWGEMRNSVAAPEVMLMVWIAAAAIAFLLAWRVDINEFSLNRFYRNRLARCFIAAGRAEQRRPNPLHGFDENDDLQLSLLGKFLLGEMEACGDVTLRHETPLPILNTALNVVGEGDATMTERRARSLFFTPFHVYSGKVSMALDQASTGRFPADVTLGSVVAISGAAANPNMGFHSSPAIAFLLTFFNVRLGWWLRNVHCKGWGQHFTLFYLFRELFGHAEDDDAYVNISDGGHFDNLGLYELVRRECDLILVGDGEADGDYTFESLGMAMRRCRADFGAEIDIEVARIRPGAEGVSATHLAWGTVKYRSGKMGRIVYFKSSVTGKEPYDVEQYRRQNLTFPHQSTGDQFFSESQFESYRQVGKSAGREFVSAIGVAPALQGGRVALDTAVATAMSK
ncbi:MAG: patatin-like phospholipase family protein [Bryobacterales bacterium]|nr:patatin-like phospholipase family protein [Bryobacterales bacterium]